MRGSVGDSGPLTAEPWQRLEPDAQWDDLVMPTAVVAALKALPGRLSERFWSDPRGRSGLLVVFRGPGGCGKTLAVRAVATELQLPVFETDLARLAAGGIAATSRALAHLFATAQQSGTVVELDGADILANDLHDYRSESTGIDISELLRRTEAYPGLVVVSCRHESGPIERVAEVADVVIDFPVPDAVSRVGFWRRFLPEEAHVGDGEIALLADGFPVTAGAIAAACAAAAQQAHTENVPLVLAHLTSALKRGDGTARADGTAPGDGTARGDDGTARAGEPAAYRPAERAPGPPSPAPRAPGPPSPAPRAPEPTAPAPRAPAPAPQPPAARPLEPPSWVTEPKPAATPELPAWVTEPKPPRTPEPPPRVTDREPPRTPEPPSRVTDREPPRTPEPPPRVTEPRPARTPEPLVAPAAARPVPAPAGRVPRPAPVAARRVFPAWLVAAAVVGGFAAIGLGLALAHGNRAKPPAPVALSREVSTGPVRFTYPGGWSVQATPALRGLTLSNAVTVGSSSNPRGQLVIGTISGTSSGLPATFTSTLAGQPEPDLVTLGRQHFYRLLDSGLTSGGGGEAAYLLASGGRTVVAVCRAGAQAFAALCERVLSTLTVTPAPAPTPALSSTYASGLNTILTGLSASRASDLAALAKARTAAAQAKAAGALADLHRRAANAVAALAAGNARTANTALSAALARMATGYANLGQAAASGNSAAYAKAQTDIAQANSAVSAALAALKKLGYQLV